MQDQQKICPHFVELLLFNSSQQILQRLFYFASGFCAEPMFYDEDGGLARPEDLLLRSLRKAQRCFAALTMKVASSRYPSMAQLTSLICQFLQVQAYLTPNKVSITVKCLFQSSIYTIRMSHSTLLMMSSALPRTRPSTQRIDCSRPTNLLMKPIFDDFLFYCQGGSNALSFPFMNLANRGMIKLRETISSRKRSSLVFLLSRTPSSAQCFYLYIAMQVYSSPSLRRQRLTVTRVQQMSGKAERSVFNKSELKIVLLKEEGMSCASASPQLVMNLFLSFSQRVCNRRIYGL